MKRYECPPKHEPTPEQIRAECAEIREEWGEYEESRRRVVRDQAVETREVRYMGDE